MPEIFYKTEGDHKNTLAIMLFWAAALILGLAFGSKAANAQMTSSPWSFQTQNRASIAALINQVEEGDTSAANAGPAAYSNDILVCGGGGGSSTATANSTCIILNNASAELQLGQDAQGDQGSTNTTPDPAPTSPADDVLSTLGQ